MTPRTWFGLSVVGMTLACASVLIRPSADDWQPAVAKAPVVSLPEREACADRDPLRRAFFGDLHVHTRYSMDARSRGMLGTPDDAYRFARGEEIGFGPFDENGRGTRRVKLERPLDFAAVTDHAEWIGEVRLCTTPGSPVHASDSCRSFRGEIETSGSFSGIKTGKLTSVVGGTERVRDICGEGASTCRDSLLAAWKDTQAAAERWNDRSAACAFTTFHGWEHSYSVNLSKVHRNVIFRNASVPELPISSLEAPDAIDLWDRLDALCTNAGGVCEAVTIPHNPNVSNGRLFQVSWKGESLHEQRRRALVRARLERVVEMMQVKGESECRNGFADVVGGPDELCGFEKIRTFGGKELPDDCGDGIGSGALGGYGCQSRLDFARYALVEGMRENERIGVNPYRFGFIGSTDGHNANPGAVEEWDWEGCCSDGDAEVEARLDSSRAFAGVGAVGRNPGGLMGVWAEENSRDALFDAILRRETFATSGPRITPRFFAGSEIPDDLCARGNGVARADAKGVAMGGVIDGADLGEAAPVFAALATRDPGTPQHPGGRLDRLQIIKVWNGDDGRVHQRVHDVAGRLAEAGASSAEPSVDLDSCEPRGPGKDQLCAVWSDPDFDPSREAAYYVRVVENPSCRWSWRSCLEIPEAERPAACSDPEIPKTVRERAWTSPIWFEPDRARASGA